MSLDLYKIYMDRSKTTSSNIKEFYDEYSQEWINQNFYDSTLVDTILEEDYPFIGEYTEYEVHVDTVSEVSVNMKKVIGDYISLIFKDCDHKTYRGQKILHNNEPYLCYDKTNDLSRIAKTQAIKCNNKLRWLNENGAIIEEPCFIGWEITSTNNQISKDATIPQRRMVVMLQGNEKTAKLEHEQRFILNNRKAFKITNMNTFVQDDFNSEDVTMYTFYIEWSEVLSTDNLELNIADYYKANYELQIDQSDLSLSNGDSGTLTATVLLNEEVTTVPLTWSTSDDTIVTIDENGDYNVVGSDGDTCTITCTIQDNEYVSSNVEISVLDTPIEEKVIIVAPSDLTSLKQFRTAVIDYGVYINGALQSDVVDIAYSGASEDKYSIVQNTNQIELTCENPSQDNLVITFTSGALIETMEIELLGIL